MLKDKIGADLKSAMLARDTETVEVLKGLKSAVMYEEVAQKKRDVGLDDVEILAVFKKESKKRQDSIGLYRQGGNEQQALKEQSEKDIIDSYLPPGLTEQEISKVISDVMTELELADPKPQDMGRIIGAVKKAAPNADGSIVASLVKKLLN
jgi:uncharacterized protein YqeY